MAGWWVELLFILGLILVNGVFSGAEIATLSVRKTRLQARLDEGSSAARAVQKLRESPERFLATVQIGITVVGAAAAAFGGASLAARLAGPLRDLGLDRSADGVAFALVVGLVSYLSLVLGELVPKSLGLRYAEGYALMVARPLRWLSRLMKPLVWFLTASSNLVLRIFGDRTNFSESRLSPDELQQLVEEAGKTGMVHPRTGEIASRAFELGRLTAAEVMVPRRDIRGVRRHASVEEVKQALLEAGHSRMPVYEDDLDHVVGYVIAKDLVFALESELFVLEDLVRPPYFVLEALPALDLLQQLQTRRMPMAMVVDERGGTAGLVTIEDLMEELVGEIVSEYHGPTYGMAREKDGTILVHANAPLREVNRSLGFSLPESDGVTTIGGLAMRLAGAIPKPGARFTSPDGTALEIIDASARRVKAVRLHPPPPPTTAEA